jgi:hypothetical protein
MGGNAPIIFLSAPAPSFDAQPAHETFSVSLYISSLDKSIWNLNRDFNINVRMGQEPNMAGIAISACFLQDLC